MPILTRDEDISSQGITVRPGAVIPQEDPVYEASTLDLAASALRQFNPVANMDILSGGRPRREPVEGFDPLANPEMMKGFEMYKERFATAESPAEFQDIKERIQQDRIDQKILADAGWAGIIASMAAGVSNPILALNMLAGPAGIVRTMAQVATVEAVSELALHSLHETRTIEESAVNIAAAAGVTGIVGGVIHRLARIKPDVSPAPGIGGDVGAGAAPEAAGAARGAFVVRTDAAGFGRDIFTKEVLDSTGQVVGKVDGVVDREANELIFRNQFVKPGFRGQNLAGKAWKEVADDALDQGMTVRSDSSVTLAAASPYMKLDPEIYTVVRHPEAKMGKTVDGDPAWKAPDSSTPVFTVTKKASREADAIANAEQAKLVKQMADDIKSPGGAAAREKPLTNVNAPQPEGFVHAPAWTPEQMASKTDVPDVVAKHLSYGNPLMRLMTAPINAVRSVAESLLETPMYLRKNRAGVPTDQALETLIKVDSAATGEALQTTRDLFNKSQGFGPGEINFIRAKLKAGWRGVHSFKEDIGRALRNGDTSNDPLVAAAAKAWRSKVFDPLKERAMKLELFPEQQILRKELTALEKQAAKEGLSDELTASIAAKTKELADWVPDPKGADSYLTRLYNYQKLGEGRDEFVAAVAQYLNAIEGFTEAEAKRTAKNIHAGLLSKDNMFGLPKPEYRGVSMVSKQAGGPLQSRVVTLPDNILEPWLISDIEHVGRTYTRRMATEINLAEKFGDRTMKNQIAAVEAEYEALIDATPNKKDKLVLHNALRDNIRDIEAMRDQFIGTYGLPSDPSGLFARGNRMARSWQYVVALGMQTISALPDMARPIVTNGLMAYGKGLAHAMPFMAKAAKEDVKRMGIGLDMLTSGRMRAIATLDEIPLVGGKFEHLTEEAASGFGKMSGMDQWNSFWKQYTGIMAVDRIAQMAERGWVKLNAKEQAQLLWLGLDATKLNGIRKGFATHGAKEGGFNVANIASWGLKSDEMRMAARDLMAAANKEADTLIVTPGKGDKPILAGTDIGKTLFQFQSFVAAATNRMLVSGIAQRDLQVVSGIFMGVVIGSISQYAKDTINGRDTKWASDPVLLIGKGLGQAGTLGLIAQIPADMAVAAYEGKSIGKSLVNAIPGVDVPAEGLIKSGASALTQIQKGQGAKAAAEAAKMLPYQNLFWLKMIFNEMGDEERSALGIRRGSGRNTGPSQHGSPFGG